MKLFRSTSRLLIAAARYMASRIGREELDDQYKSYKLFLRVLTRALTGEYTNFGIFEVWVPSFPIFPPPLSFRFSMSPSEVEYEVAI